MRRIQNNNTIIDYFDAVLELDVLRDMATYAIALDKSEWNQFLTLIKDNYKDCAAVINVADANLAKYKDIVVYWNGDDTPHRTPDYMESLEGIRYEIQNHHNMIHENNGRPQDAVAGTGQMRAEPRRPGRDRNINVGLQATPEMYREVTARIQPTNYFNPIVAHN